MAAATSRPRTPGRSPPPEALPSIVENVKDINGQGHRKSSLNFLRRPKSTEPLGGDRKSSGGKTSKKMLKELAREEELHRQREAAVPRHAPRLPALSPTPQLETFGGKDRSDDESAIPNRIDSRTSSLRQGGPVPPLPISRESYDPYARTESMTHRGRYSYASSAVSSINSPRRLRRRKDPTPYK